MSLSVLGTYHAIATNLTVPFTAVGGTGPYTFSLITNFSGSFIDPTTGMYTSGNFTGAGSDIIQVTDALSASATWTITVMTALELVCDIIQTGMNLPAGNTYLWDQKINIPINSELYIAVGVNYCKPFGNKPRYEPSDYGMTATQSVNMLANLSIDILSRGPAARDQKELVLLALSSPYAQQQMELNSFFIAPLSTGFVNLSQIDGAAIPYRFNISANLQYFVSITTPVSYYDTFAQPTVTDEA